MNMQSFLTRCFRLGCNKSFFHGDTFEDISLCYDCSKEFMKSFENFSYRNVPSDFRCRRHFEEDLRRFLQTKKGDNFTPSTLSHSEEVVMSYDLFTRKKVEVLSDSDEEDSFQVRMKKINETFEARFRSFQTDTNFVTVFRQKLSQCSDEVLISLMRAGEAHAVSHRDEGNCDGCQDSDDELELSHNTRGLGDIWLETVKEQKLGI